MRILIADDDRMSTLMLSRTLERWGFEVVVAHDGVAAWEVHQRRRSRRRWRSSTG